MACVLFGFRRKWWNCEWFYTVYNEKSMLDAVFRRLRKKWWKVLGEVIGPGCPGCYGYSGNALSKMTNGRLLCSTTVHSTP
jgi:hypothetical protein